MENELAESKVSIAKCPHCGANMKKYWRRLTPGLLNVLVMAYTNVCAKKENNIKLKSLGLNNSQYCAFQSLRFHGLIAHVKVDGKRKVGEWLITHRGAQFLHGEITIPAQVLTWRNRVVDYWPENVSLRDVIGTQPYYDKGENFEIADSIQNMTFA